MGAIDMRAVGVLGDGVTATAVRSFLLASTDYFESSVAQADIIVTSPGIPPRQWPETSTEVISDIEFASRVLMNQNKSPQLIGITGTNGKTTVAMGLAHVMNTIAYGNVGRPLISDVDHIRTGQPVILELSSYQLATSPTLACSIAVIMNIESDHIAWHGTADAYKQAKLSIITSAETVYIPRILMSDIPLDTGGNIQIIEDLPSVQLPNFLADHNALNAAVIIDVAEQLGQDRSNAMALLRQFKRPPFRCQCIEEAHGRTIINDSKATNMAATIAAVSSIGGPKLLILAGEPKSDYSEAFLIKIMAQCHTVYVAGGLSQQRHVFPKGWHSQLVFFDTLKAATISALNTVGTGTILFSPSAASFDEFTNYLDRGSAFTDYVHKNSRVH
ncbi:MAG: Mur ligase family protein [Candidatus Marinamargulisbacteria bacterium]